jgi:hypothetical protein
MATLNVASKANAALILPAILAGASAVHDGLQLDIRYEDVESLASSDNCVELITGDGDHFVDDAVIHYFQDNIRDRGRVKKSDVGCCPIRIAIVGSD